MPCAPSAEVPYGAKEIKIFPNEDSHTFADLITTHNILRTHSADYPMDLGGGGVRTSRAQKGTKRWEVGANDKLKPLVDAIISIMIFDPPRKGSSTSVDGATSEHRTQVARGQTIMASHGP